MCKFYISALVGVLSKHSVCVMEDQSFCVVRGNNYLFLSDVLKKAHKYILRDEGTVL